MTGSPESRPTPRSRSRRPGQRGLPVTPGSPQLLWGAACLRGRRGRDSFWIGLDPAPGPLTWGLLMSTVPLAGVLLLLVFSGAAAQTPEELLRRLKDPEADVRRVAAE